MIPQPVRVRALTGEVVLGPDTIVTADAELEATALLFAGELRRATGWRVPVHVAVEAAREPPVADGPVTIALRLGEVPGAPPGDESYRLTADAGLIELTGTGPAGAFYATRTLRQLLPAELLREAPLAAGATNVAVDAVEIVDGPRFAWRGAHLDVARHFLPKAWLLRLVDLVAMHKLNVLHLHLTDDQGWRLPVPGWPRLTEVGAWRRASPSGHQSERRTDETPHGGFYSRDDLRELVAYAAARHVVVVPEIDMPGHMQAAIAAYPELGNTTATLEVSTEWGISEHVLNLDDATVAFCTDVLDEVLEIFPSSAIHIGGDECPTAEWVASERAQARRRALGLASDAELQGWFTGQIADHLRRAGRRLVGWDELLEGGAPSGSVIMAWRSQRAGRAALEAGHDVVMAPMQWLYFDWAYADDPREPLAICPATSVERVYGYEPVPTRLTPEVASHVLGAQCQLWTEYVATPGHAEYLYFPRLCAFSEVVWSSPERDFGEFSGRLEQHLERLGALGVNYRPLDGPTPGQARTWIR